MTTLSKLTPVGTQTQIGKFLGISKPLTISGIFSPVGWFEVKYKVCGKTLDDIIEVTSRKYAELLGQDSENYYFGYTQ